MIEAYPLAWPIGWPRAGSRKRAQFRGRAAVLTRELSVAEGTLRVRTEVWRIGCERGSLVISTNLRLNSEGMPSSKARVPDDPGVAVYWSEWVETSPGFGQTVPRCMAIDIYDRVADNLAAVAATIEALRAIERHGGASIMQRAFTGFTALPAPSTPGWPEVLGFKPGEVVNADMVEHAYRVLRSKHHPDKGGNPEAFSLVQRAYELARAHLEHR